MVKNLKTFKFTLSAMVIIAFLVMPLASNGQAGKANFSGTWAFNAEKSTPGQGQGQPPQGGGQGQGQGMRGGFGGNFVAKQEANLLTVERTMGDRTISSKYTLDGKESVNATGRGESKSIATWSADGKSLSIVTTRSFERDGQTTQMKTTEVWALTDPSTLTITSTRTTPNGERKTAMVYNKK
jgi:hypothetical protein